MCARARPPVIHSVQTPDALASLRAWLDAFEPKTRKLGESTFSTKQVKKIGTQADHYVEATVSEEAETFPVTLFLTRGQWTAKCTCDLRKDCRHIYAAGLAWLADVETGSPNGADPAGTPSTAPVPAAPPLAPTAPVNKHTFRVQWSPVLAEKLGRSGSPRAKDAREAAERIGLEQRIWRDR